MRAILAACLLGVSSAQRKQEPAYCLASPFVPDDNTRWETGAGAKVENEYVRLTPDFPARTGYLWSRIPNSKMTDWEVVLEFKVGGQHTEGGGEGFGFWYAEKRMLGPVFGSADYWNGLGVFFDTYNNDRKGNSPMVVAIYNDGTQAYSAFDDGARQALGQCHAPYLRNRNQNSFARIIYTNNVLTVELAFDSPGGVPNYQSCITAKVQLGMDKFFGVTARTGQPIVTNPPSPQPADNHDLFSLTTFDLSPARTDSDIRERRERYMEEQQQTHSQMPGHQDLSSDQFRHQVIALLGQVEGAIQLLDQSQLNIQNALSNAHKADQDRDVENRRSAQASKGIATQDSNTIKNIIADIMRSQDELQRLQGGGGGNDPNAAASYRQLQSSYAQMNEELKALRTTLQQGGGGTGQALGDTAGNTEAVAIAVKAALNPQLNNFEKSHTKRLDDLVRSLQEISSNTDDVLGRLDGNGESSGGGWGWIPTLLLTILLAEVAAMMYLQLKKGSSGGRSKFV